MIHPRPEVQDTRPAEHGGPAGTRDEHEPVHIDFSASINAWGAAPVVREAIAAAAIEAYPDPESLLPRRVAARRWDMPLDEVIFGAGASELIHALCFAFLRPADGVLVPDPTFSEYARAAQLCGARLLRGMADPPDYLIDAAAVADGVLRHRPKLAFLCAPNNPTGQAFRRDELKRVADACRRAGTLLVIDQSYDAFPKHPLGTPVLPGHPAVLHLRSITKDHALAGVRAAFAVGPAQILAALDRARVPWTASTLAQAAACAALSDQGEEHLSRTLPRLRYQRERMVHWLTQHQIPCVPSETHFFLVGVGNATRVADRLRRLYGIGVRDCTSFGLPQHIRVAARTSEENDVLLNALGEVCST
jgi:histidinol-phosphate aminotransferase